MTAQHTPGPWCLQRNVTNYRCGSKSLQVRGAADELIATLPGCNRDTGNSRLIAAAPEQHELLQTFTEWARQVAARADLPQGIRSAAANLHDDGKRLLAKATGEAA